MENKNLALLYIRNGVETIFPVKDIFHAIKLADAIADSDLLNDSIDYNMFEVFYYCLYFGAICLQDCWESDEYESFNEYWENLRRENK